MTPNTTPPIPPVKFEDAFKAELKREQWAFFEINNLDATRAAVKEHNSHRSKLIWHGFEIKKWDKNPAPVEIDSVPFKMINGKRVEDPFIKAAKQLGIKERTFTLPANKPAPQADQEARGIVASVRCRFKQLRNFTHEEWSEGLAKISDEKLRIRIAKLIWWDMANYLPRDQDSLLTRLMKLPITSGELSSFSVEQVALELWGLGWPATNALERATHAQS